LTIATKENKLKQDSTLSKEEKMLDIIKVNHDVSEENPKYPCIMVDDREGDLVLAIGIPLGLNGPERKFCVPLEREVKADERYICIDNHHLTMFKGEITLKNK